MTKRETMQTISDIADRALAVLSAYGIRAQKIDLFMDLDYVNDVCPLDFDRLLAFDDENFAHDITGIYKHFDRATKTLKDCFVPRCSKPETYTGEGDENDGTIVNRRLSPPSSARRPKYAGTQFEKDGHTWTGGLYSTGPTDAIDEAIVGNHVAHVRNPDNDRVVAIRVTGKPYPDPDYRREFELTFSDPKVDLRRSGDTLTVRNVKEADKAIRKFLVGKRVEKSVDYYQDEVNQARRDCEIIEVGRTRVRIRYELPNSGDTYAWRALVTVGDYHYIGAVV